MSGKLGYDNLKKLLFFVVEVGNIAEDFIGGEGSTWSKISGISGLFDEVTGLLTCDWSQIKSELLDLDAAERAQLLADCKEKFDIEDDQIEDRIERGFDIAVELYGVIKKSIDYSKEWKKK